MESEELFQITVEKLIHPEGAHEDATAFRIAANHFRQMADSLRTELGRLDHKWEGRARDRFFEEVNPLPNRLDAFADTLESVARSIDQKKVMVRETIWVTRDQIY